MLSPVLASVNYTMQLSGISNRTQKNPLLQGGKMFHVEQPKKSIYDLDYQFLLEAILLL